MFTIAQMSQQRIVSVQKKTNEIRRGRKTCSARVIRAFWKKEQPRPAPATKSPSVQKSLFSSFGKKRLEPPAPEPVAQKKRSLFSFGKEKTREVREEQTFAYEESKTEAYARIRAQRKRKKDEFEAKEKGGLSAALFKVARAIDFQEDIEADRGILAKARNMAKGESMSREQYGALKRKVGGTKGGFFGESVDVKGEYTDAGWTKRNEDTTMSSNGFPPAVAAAIGVGIVATLVLVAQQVP